MEEQEIKFHLDSLRECDPDYICDVLEISAKELVALFEDRAISFIKEEWDV